MLCELCGRRAATLTDRTVVNNGVAEYSLCEECYKAVVKSGRTVPDVICELHARKGRECPTCGMTAERFGKTFMFGCPDCYRSMRDVAVAAAEATQHAAQHVGKRLKRGRNGR